MIRINILFPWEKRRIIKKILPKIEKEYNKKVKRTTWNDTGSTECSFYVILEDGKPLYIRVDLDTYEILTICEDMSF